MTFALAPGHCFTPLDNWQKSIGIAFAYRLHKAKAAVEIRRVQIVEEKPADAALLIAMLQEKVIVAPFL
jgi:hypothetical protein